MSDEFNKPHNSIRMKKVNDVESRERSIRLYKSSPENWTLQLRAPIGLGVFGLRDGKDFIVASATCSLDDLRSIRDAIDAKIQEADGVTITGRGICSGWGPCKFHETGGAPDESCTNVAAKRDL